MFDWLFCSTTKNRDDALQDERGPNSLAGYTNTVDVEPVSIESDEKMNEKRQFILNTFKQGHIIQAYKQLNEAEKQVLIKDLELIQFDMVDLVKIKISQFLEFS